MFPDRFLLSEIEQSGIDLAILGTTLVTGGCVSFTKDGIALYEDDLGGKGRVKEVEKVAVSHFDIQHAIAASAAFPPVLPPLLIERSCFDGEIAQRDLKQLSGHDIADGAFATTWV